ncbi:MAG TPA: GAF domain-containing protein, partial [Caldilineaceae bacterium]|nr:GAF domain-containing protein [Caldilineaceae bacterium]
MRPLHRQATLEQLLPGASEMAARMRAFDWSSTGLGSPEQWPQSLKTSVRILLTARQPMVVWWGERFITLYNDSCARFLPANHPAALGEPASAVWPELWAQIGAHAASVRHGNEGAYDEALPIIGICNGCPQEIYVTLSYSPLPNDDGSSGGVFCSLNEETQRILGERQESLLRTLAASIATAQTKQEVCTLAASAIKSNPHDLPFALFYLRDPQNRSAVLAGRVGLAPDAKSAPQSVALAAASDWPVGEVIRTRQATLLSELTGLAAELPRMRGYAVRQAFTLPIALPGAQDALGVLVVGLNPLRLWGDGYRRFLEQVAAQVAQALVSAVDIPAHKRAEQELLRLKDELAQRATDKYLALFNAIDEGFAIIELLYDANGRPFDFRVLEVNPAPEKMSGLQVHVGQTARQHVPDLEDFWIETLSAVATTGESVRFERYSHAVGCWFTVFAAKIGGQESRQVAVIFQDISAHKRREANLAFLAEISEVASRLSSYREMMYTVAAKIGAFLELSACSLSEIDESQERFVQTYGWQGGESPQVTSTNDRLAGCLSEGLLRAARAGEIAIIGNIAHDPRT